MLLLRSFLSYLQFQRSRATTAKAHDLTIRSKLLLEALEDRTLLTARLSGGLIAPLGNPAPTSSATYFRITGPSLPSANTSFSITVSALNSSNNVVAGYQGTVHFTSSDPTAILPGNYTFTSTDLGVHVFGGVLIKDPTSATITVTDTSNPSITGTLRVGAATTAGGAFEIVLGPTGVPLGAPFSITAQVTTPFTTIHFLSSDPLAILPPDYTFTAADINTVFPLVSSHSFSGVRLNTPGFQSITFQDSAGINAVPLVVGVGRYFFLIPDMATTAGAPMSLTVKAMNGDQIITDFAETIAFSSTDPKAILPKPYTFKPSDAGVHTFQLSFFNAGGQIVDVTNSSDSSMSGSQVITVEPAPASHFSVLAPGTVAAGSTFPLKVIAVDDFNNIDTNYTGTVHFTSSDARAVLPSDYTFTIGGIGADDGVHTFSLSGLKASEQTRITVTDAQKSSLKGQTTLTVAGIGGSLATLKAIDGRAALLVVDLVSDSSLVGSSLPTPRLDGSAFWAGVGSANAASAIGQIAGYRWPMSTMIGGNAPYFRFADVQTGLLRSTDLLNQSQYFDNQADFMAEGDWSGLAGILG